MALKEFSICVAGIANAGKTTFVRRLITGEYRQTKPTLGTNIEIINVEESVFRLFDLGGQLPFRNALWESYVRLSQGVIFIFDSSDRSTIDDAKEWLQKVIDWARSESTFAFFANKIDLSSRMEIAEIAEALELNRFSSTPNRSFQIFEVSMKTGENLDKAMNWLKNKMIKQNELFRVKVQRIVVLNKDGKLMMEFLSDQEHIPLKKFLPLLRSIINFESEEKSNNQNLLEFSFESSKVVITRNRSHQVAIFITKEESSSMVTTIGEAILSYLDSPVSIESGYRINELVEHFCRTNFPECF